MQIIKSSSILIRLANAQDKKAIMELEELAIKNLYSDRYNTQKIENLTQNIDRINFKDEILFVAEKNNFIVGFASLLSYRKILRTLYVKPKLLRQQIGSQLLQAIEQEAIEHQIKTLKVTPSLTDRAFYTSLGYEEIAFCHLDKMDLLIPCIAMEKQLIPRGYHHLFLKIAIQIVLATLPNLLLLLLI